MNLIYLGLACAAACAFFTNLGFLFKHRGCQQAPPVSLRHPLRSGLSLWQQKWFAIGMAVAALGFAFHAFALALAPLSLVQAVIAGGLVWLAVLAERCFGLSLGWRQWAGVLCTAGGLALLALTVPGSAHAQHGYSTGAMIAFQAGLVVAGGLLVLSPRAERLEAHHGTLMGAAAGLMFGMSDVAIKALSDAGGPMGVLSSPWLALALLGAVVGFYASARSFQEGEAVPVITFTSLAANLSGIVGGFVVFGDPLPADTLGVVGHVAAFALVLMAAWLVPAPVRIQAEPAQA
jgi:drug/metabolite transporter (DMT)-like permease